MSKTYTNKDLKKDFIYNLQFYIGNDKVLSMQETANKSNGLHDASSMFLFGLELAESDLLDERDKFAFSELCRGFIRRYHKTTEADDR